MHTLMLLLACSWILWAEYQSIGVSKDMDGRSWEVQSAYPSHGYAACAEDAQIRATRHAAPNKAHVNVKRQEHRAQMGGKHLVTTEYKSGGIGYVTYGCFPDTIDPSK